ncbi:MAG: aminopeptidase P N-terminal domain-containing protein [Propionibacteriaceae bacterium]|jgi:Xaa-Pro aminopeptidase|nr:aminopeptidase P N-terminal domain-containing protein [Propionibacteriaceae bacterium]
MTLLAHKPPYSGQLKPKLSEVPAFVEMIGQGWRAERRPAPLVPGAAAAAAKHRALLSDAIGQRDIVVFCGHAPVRNNDCNFDFRGDSNFIWLVGAQVEFAALVMRPNGAGHDATLYLTPPAKPGERDFFASAAYGELWVGPSAALEDWQEGLGMDVQNYTAFEAALGKLADPLVSGTVPSDELAAFHVPASAELDKTLAHLRMFKDEWEVAQLREAVDASVGGFAAVAGAVPQAMRMPRGERWLQGTFDRHARAWGNGVGYATIVGSGPHAPTLHWVRCDGDIIPDMPLLLDMGVEANSYYTADVTRTIPPTGEFSPAGRRVHDLVEASHRAGLAAAVDGAHFLDFHYASMEVLAQGLHDWGLLPVSVDEALSPEGQQHRRYIVCGVGHHLGLDVHDCAKSDVERYDGANLAPGMVFTVEPGLYFHANDLTVPPELRGVGVRIEDDVWIRPDGTQEVLSAALPISAGELEAWTKAQQ